MGLRGEKLAQSLACDRNMAGRSETLRCYLNFEFDFFSRVPSRAQTRTQDDRTAANTSFGHGNCHCQDLEWPVTCHIFLPE